MKKSAPRHDLITRREAARTVLLTLGGAALVACGGGSSEPSAGGSSRANGGTPPGGGTSTDAGTSTSSGSATEWASGGTKSMTAAASYPDPFATPAAACVLATAATEGPCTEAADQVRKDISESYPGLPMRLALRVVDRSCKPIAGAKVKIWHTQITGSYSGDTPNNAMCLMDQADASKHYFRGAQTTDANGRVDFDSCFPGWYPGRAIHIHFTVSRDGRSFTSQLVFDDALAREIFASHAEYMPHGQPDTTNATDGIVSRGDLAGYMLATARMSDGAMLASKDLVFDV